MVRRVYALIVLGVGLVALVLGLTKVLPGGVIIGGSLAFLGLLLTGLSFVPAPQPAPDAPPPMPAFERIAGLFYMPSDVFRNLRAHPRWLTALLIITLVNFIYTVAFTQRLTPERIADHTADKLRETGWMTPEQIEMQRQEQIDQAKNPVKIAGSAVSSFVAAFTLMTVVAGLYLLGALAFGGRMNFWQALATATHVFLPVTIIQKLLSLLLLYLKSPDDVHPILGQNGIVQDNLGVLVSPSEHPVLFTAASAIGVLSFYGLWLTATGLKNASERLSSTAAWSIAITIWVIGLILALISATLFGSFIS